MILKETQMKDRMTNQPYRGELKAYLNQCNPSSMFVAKRAAEMIIEHAMRSILERDNLLERFKLIKTDVAERQEAFLRLKDRTADKAVVLAITDALYQRVLARVMKEAASEVTTLNTLASSISLNIIINALKTERSTANTIPRLQKLFSDLREP